MIPLFLRHGVRLIIFAIISSLLTCCTNDYFQQGRADQEAGHIQAAIADYTKAISLNPEDATAYKYRAGAYAKIGEYQNAIDDFTEALKLDPKDDWYLSKSVYLYRGQSWYQLEQYDKAIDDFSTEIRRSLSHTPIGSTYGYGERACCYAKRGDYQKAVDDLTKAVSFDPKNASYYENRAWCYNKLQQYTKVVSDCTEAISLDLSDAVDSKLCPNDNMFCPKLAPCGTYYQRAKAYEKLGKKDLAEKDKATAAR